MYNCRIIRRSSIANNPSVRLLDIILHMPENCPDKIIGFIIVENSVLMS